MDSVIDEHTDSSNRLKEVSYLKCIVSRATRITARINTTGTNTSFLTKVNAFNSGCPHFCRHHHFRFLLA